MTKDHNGWPYTDDTNGERVFKVTRSFDTSQAAWLFMKRQNIITRYLAAIKKHNIIILNGVKTQVTGGYYLHRWDYESNCVDHWKLEEYELTGLKPKNWHMHGFKPSYMVAAEFTAEEMKLILTGSE